MPLTPNFNVSQSLADARLLTFHDLSTGSDVSITSRRIYVTDDLGQPIVEDGTTTTYEEWPLPLSTDISLNLLGMATAPRIKVDYLDVSNAVVVSKTISFGFPNQLILAGYNLTRAALSKPRTLEDANYYANKMKLLVSIDDGNNAVAYASDIVNAQSSYDRGTALIQNESINF